MPIIKFKEEDKWGLKNSAGTILVSPLYEEVYITENGAVASEYIYDETEDTEVIRIIAFDNAGDKTATISEELAKQNIDRVLDFWQLTPNLFGFQFSNWDSRELCGVFNSSGQIVISPEFDEVGMLAFSEHILTCYHGAHYEEYDGQGIKNYGQKIFDQFGNPIVAESIKDFQDLENGEHSFVTDSGRQFKTNKYGKTILES